MRAKDFETVLHKHDRKIAVMTLRRLESVCIIIRVFTGKMVI